MEFDRQGASGEEPACLKARIVDQALEPVFNDPAHFSAFLTSEREKAKRRLVGVELR